MQQQPSLRSVAPVDMDPPARQGRITWWFIKFLVQDQAKRHNYVRIA